MNATIIGQTIAMIVFVWLCAKYLWPGIIDALEERQQEIEKIRNVSRAKNGGPWKDWYEEMAKKSVIRRLAKYLPQSTDIEDVLSGEEEQYDEKPKRRRAAKPKPEDTAKDVTEEAVEVEEPAKPKQASRLKDAVQEEEVEDADFTEEPAEDEAMAEGSEDLI